MAKRLFLLIIASLMSVISAPGILTAADTVNLTGLDNTGVVETIPLPEPESEPEPVHTAPVVARVAAPTSTPVTTVAPVYVAPANNIQINGRTVELSYTGSTGEDAGGVAKAWYYSTGKFVYGHNSGNVFGFLNSAYDGGWLNGMSFTVTMNGSAQTYTVANYRLYDYNPSDPNHLVYEGGKITMKPIVDARLDGVNYRMAIMTCYAGSSKRLVVFAN